MLLDMRRPAAPERNASVDGARARELYKYFCPPTADGELPDTVLTAHAQLVAWRLNAERSMITLIDVETQYFVAESTKTLHLDGTLKHDHPDDAIWAGCVRVPMAGRLCEHTLATLPPPDGGPACFEVLDLSKDDRFKYLDFVIGKPFFRNYVGVPLRTRKGINIGSLFIINSKVRPALTSAERQFLGIMATNVIQHLEMEKEKRDHRRTSNMHRCLSTYVDPEFQRKRRKESPSRTVGVRASSATIGPDGSNEKVGGFERHEIFSPAAELLREALDLEGGGGGVIFLDIGSSLGRSQLVSADTDKSETSSGPESDRDDFAQFSRPTSSRNISPSGTPSSRTHSPVRSARAAHNISTEILAHAYHPIPKPHTSKSAMQNFIPLSPEDLAKLMKRHPRGKLFTFDSEGHVVSSSEEEKPTVTPARGNRQHMISKSRKEARKLRSHFPMARQIIFLPLMDPTTSRKFTCFIYNCSEYRDFSRKSELLYSITFTNCIMTEIARLATLKANQQKSDFIGSISHELRSPLHGILASCEFLEDTECSKFQRSLVDTADSCARTLLDTINMVLDYSNINTFEKKAGRARLSKRGTPRTSSPARGLQSNLSIYQYVDLAVMTEEVVDGVAIGHVFASRPHTPNLTSATTRRDEPLGTETRAHLDVTSSGKDIDLIIDAPCRNWTYWSQPGALRRIIMNLVGNSLKYTKSGFVHIQLEAHEDVHGRRLKNRDYVTLTVTDSGQGMSAAYMKDKLFTPFAQESSLTPGTGLGLSLVKSIVRMLDGKIDIKSNVGVGTKVIVELPMTRETLASNGVSPLANSVGSVIERVKEDSLEMARQQATKRTVAIYSRDRPDTTKAQKEATHLMRESLKTYASEWCGFKVHRWSIDTIFDVVICERTDLNHLIRADPHLFTSSSPTRILVLCDTAAAQEMDHSHVASNKLDQVRYPVGPYKFSRALHTCFEHLKKSENARRGAGDSVAGNHTETKAADHLEAVTTALRSAFITENGKISNTGIVKDHKSTSYKDDVKGRTIANDVDTSRVVKAKDNVSDLPGPTGDVSCQSDCIGFSMGSVVLPTPSPENLVKSKSIPLNPKETLPAARNDAPIPGVSAPQTVQIPRLPRMLLVEDNAINLRLLQVFMKKRNYKRVISALDGQQAVSAYRTALHATPSEPPDIILMDISMPVLDGFEATRQIRGLEREWNAPLRARRRSSSKLGTSLKDDVGETRREVKALIIALTGLASVRDQKEAFSAGADVYMMKPASFAKLSGIMDEWEGSEESSG